MVNLWNYVDDTTFHARDSDIGNLSNKLEHASILAIKFFESNYMKLNKDNCHFLLPGYKHEIMFVVIEESRLSESEKQKLVGVTIR